MPKTQLLGPSPCRLRCRPPVQIRAIAITDRPPSRERRVISVEIANPPMPIYDRLPPMPRRHVVDILRWTTSIPSRRHRCRVAERLRRRKRHLPACLLRIPCDLSRSIGRAGRGEDLRGGGGRGQPMRWWRCCCLFGLLRRRPWLMLCVVLR